MRRWNGRADAAGRGRGRLAVFAVAAWLAAGPASAAGFRLCTADEWPPYTTIDKGQIGGSHTELIRAAFRRMGEPLDIVSLPWARCLAEVASGEQDGAYAASLTTDRAAMALYPATALGEVSYVLVTLRSAVADWNGAPDPKTLPQPVAAPHGYSILGTLHGLDGVQVVDHLPTDDADLAALLDGEVGTIAIERGVARYVIARDHVEDKVAVLDPPLVPAKKYYMIVSRRYAGGGGAKAFTDRFSDALKAVEATAR